MTTKTRKTDVSIPDGFTERKMPTLISFDEPGAFVLGTLLKVQPITVKGKTVLEYLVRERNGGETVKFLGTYQINQMIQIGDAGRDVYVAYTGEDDDVQRNGNSMKVFTVAVSPNRAGDDSFDPENF